MAYKIYTTNNYIFVEDTVTGIVLSDSGKNVLVTPADVSAPTYNVSSPSISIPPVDPTEVLDASDSPYTEEGWISFYTQSTGFSSAPGGSGAGRVQEFTTAQRLALSVSDYKATIVFDTDTETFWGSNGLIWIEL